ncbi:hypothetical protein CDD80_4701 [Ophiocordyceps camponoti-rufipedis]|uniref:Uncharacterized protein n=1 Tax=Ophiocordyceps camponoti-rufipedis TaxID=2004952 RepID=A0A2C5ZJ75_9HYPO|nr:hypothetical protein CDD80_4701 [Ophiocordyceps camponoti-rufipedis]
MDHFPRLPSEISLAILESAETWQDMVKMSHESSTLFRYRMTFTSHLNAFYLAKKLLRVFTPDLVQDAMGILHFPEESGDEESHKEDVDEHLRKWAAKTLPDPIRDRDVGEMKRLERLFKQLRRYMDDYLSKATETKVHPRFAYAHLPVWANADLHRAYMKPRLVCPRPTDKDIMSAPFRPKGPACFKILSSTEKYRFLRSFLRLELYSKLYAEYIWGMPSTECKEPEIWETEGLRSRSHVTTGELSCVSRRMQDIFWPDGFDLRVWLEVWFAPSHIVINHLSLSGLRRLDQVLTSNIMTLRSSFRVTEVRRLWERICPVGHLTLHENSPELHRRDFSVCKGLRNMAFLYGGFDMDMEWISHTLDDLSLSRELFSHLRSWNWLTISSDLLVRDPKLVSLINKVVASTYRQRAWALLDDKRWFQEVPDIDLFPTAFDIWRASCNSYPWPDFEDYRQPLDEGEDEKTERWILSQGFRRVSRRIT